MAPDDLADQPEPRATFSTECKPDVLVRLRSLLASMKANRSSFYADEIEPLADAIDAIEGLRKSDERRLGMVNDLKVALALEKDIAAARLEGIDRGEALLRDARERITELEGALTAIAGGHIPGISMLVLAGNWQAVVNAMQTVARDTLPTAPPATPTAQQTEREA